MTNDIEPLQVDAAAIVRAEIDVQIATAKKYPRDVEAARAKALAAVQDPKTAEACVYVLPKGGQQEGASVRLAELVYSLWGNLRVETRVVEVTETQVVVAGMCHDLESNNAMKSEAVRSIVDSKGKRYVNDLIAQAQMAAAAIARRNAILTTVPKTEWGPVYDEAHQNRKKLVTDAKTELADGIAYFRRDFGVPAEVVLEAIGLKDVSRATVAHALRLRGFAAAVQDGREPEDIFGEYEPIKKAEAP